MAEVLARDPYDPRALDAQERAMEEFKALARSRPQYAVTQEQAYDYIGTLGKLWQPATEGFARCYPRAAKLMLDRTDVVEGEESYLRWMRGEYRPGATFGVFPLTETVVQTSLTLTREGVVFETRPGDSFDFGDYGYLARINQSVFGAPDKTGKISQELIGLTEVLSTYGYGGYMPKQFMQSYFYDFGGRETVDGVHETVYEHFPLTDDEHNISVLEPQAATEFLGEEAASIYASYDRFGLAQYRIHTGMNNICAGLLG